MKTYQVTLETPGLREGSHYYSDVKVRAGSAKRAEQIAEKRHGGRAVHASETRR
jgi:hypothetical protein